MKPFSHSPLAPPPWPANIPLLGPLPDAAEDVLYPLPRAPGAAVTDIPGISATLTEKEAPPPPVVTVWQIQNWHPLLGLSVPEPTILLQPAAPPPPVTRKVAVHPPAGAQYATFGASTSDPLVGSTAGGEMEAEAVREGETLGLRERLAEAVGLGVRLAVTVGLGVRLAEAATLALAGTLALGEALALADDDQPGLTVGEGEAVREGDGTQAVSVTEPALPSPMPLAPMPPPVYAVAPP